MNKPADKSPAAVPSRKALAVFDAYVTIGRDNKSFGLLPDGRAEVQVSRQDLADSMGWSSRATPRAHIVALRSSGLIETCGSATVLNLDKRSAHGPAAPVLRLVAQDKAHATGTEQAETQHETDGDNGLRESALSHAQVLFDTAAEMTATAASMTSRDRASEILSHVPGVSAAASALVAVAEQRVDEEPLSSRARGDRADSAQSARSRAENAQASRTHAPIYPPKGGRSIDKSIDPRDHQTPIQSSELATRNRTETIALVRPLHDASVAAGGEGITNEAGMHQLLTGLSDQQLRTGVAKLLTQTDTHAGSLVGVLCNRAKEADNCPAFWNDPLPDPGGEASPLVGMVSAGRVHDGNGWVEQ